MAVSMKSSSHVPIRFGAERINLPAWLSSLSDSDYQACSRGHIAAGTFRKDGTLGMVNVESIGGHPLVQHYLATTATADHVVMHSTATRVYVMHVAPATVEVIWTMRIEPRDAASAVFHCTVETLIPTPLGVVATLGLLPLFLRRHVVEEAPLFAADIERKIGAALL